MAASNSAASRPAAARPSAVAKEPAAARRARRDPAGTRERLLDASEVLFARRGFRGASVRSITALAGCNLAAVNYHFGGKAVLYREMFRRRLGALRDQRIRGLRRTLDDAGPRVGLESLLRVFTTAFLEPHLEESGGRLMQLFSRELLDPHLPPSTLRRELVQPVHEALIEAIASIGLDAGGRAGRRCVQSLVAQLVHVVRMRAMPRVSGATVRGDFALPEIIDHIVRFSAAGMRACVAARVSR